MRLMWMLVVLLIHGIAYAEPGQVRRFPAQGRVHVQLRVQAPPIWKYSAPSSRTTSGCIRAPR